MSESSISRRTAVKTIATGAVASAVASAKPSHAAGKLNLKGNIKHSACLWCYNKVPKEQFVKAAAEMGLFGIDLVSQPDWDLLKKHGLFATMVPGAGGIGNGLNDKSNHQKCMEQFKENIPAAAKAGWKNVITFSGSRKGKSDEEGWGNCLEILKEAVKIAEDNKIIINMELLNSKVDHPDYQCDKSAWGIELCKRVNSPNFKLLFDIYHMQIMEGDIIRTIRENIQHFGHFHTGGNPGRHEIDGSQELNYTPVMKAIAELGYDGFVAQEFVPTRDPLTSLRECVMICDV